MIHHTCPHCEKPMSIPDKFAGQTGKCNHCGGLITVPSQIPPLPSVPLRQSPLRKTRLQIETRTSSPLPNIIGKTLLYIGLFSPAIYLLVLLLFFFTAELIIPNDEIVGLLWVVMLEGFIGCLVIAIPTVPLCAYLLISQTDIGFSREALYSILAMGLLLVLLLFAFMYGWPL